jgi:hypothetical protein
MKAISTIFFILICLQLSVTTYSQSSEITKKEIKKKNIATKKTSNGILEHKTGITTNKDNQINSTSITSNQNGSVENTNIASRRKFIRKYSKKMATSNIIKL